MSIEAAARVSAWLMLLALATTPALAKDEVDLATINRIVDEALNHSELPHTAAYMTDRIGGRLTNSPQMREAERWTQQRFRAWGLTNVRAEGFDFGRGWSIEQASTRMLAPRIRMMRSIPIAWTPATDGALRVPVIVAPLKRERDFDKWKGKLRGKIVLVSQPDQGSEPDKPAFRRYSDEELAKRAEFLQPRHSEAEYAAALKAAAFDPKRDAFLAAEGALAWVRKSARDGALVDGTTYGATAYGYKAGETPKLPGIELAAEDYRLLARLAKVGDAPTIEIVSNVKYHDDDPNAYNIIAEIPGRDAKAGYVLAGAHLDSWVASDGAQDNAAGCAIVMEAARIIAKLGIKPKRAIRFALWNAEEPGLLGSIAYVQRHLATRAPLTDPQIAKLNPYFSQSWQRRWPVTPGPGHDQLVAYFNVDNGAGKVRGIHAEGNLAVVPIFKQWLAPFASMGATTVAARGSFGTDHEAFHAVGIPGFQFIQDSLDYHSRVHHSNLDSYDHLKLPDMKQATVILASFLVNAADRAEPLPRMPLPTRPQPTDPFAYDEDEE